MIKRTKEFDSYQEYFEDWCNEVLSEEDKYMLLDTETTGLGSKSQIVELAITGPSCEVLYNKLMRPSTGRITQEAVAIHHITEEMVSTAPSFKDEWPEIRRIIGDRIVLSWNWSFDERMLKQSAAAHKIEWPFINGECAMLGYTEYYQLGKWEKLQDACKREKIDFQQDHRALGDVMATLEVIRAVAKKELPKPPDLQDWDDVRKVLEG